MTKLFMETLLIHEMVYKVMWDFSLLYQEFQHQPRQNCPVFSQVKTSILVWLGKMEELIKSI